MKNNTTWISDIKEVIGDEPVLYYNDISKYQRRIKFYKTITNEQLKQLHTHIQAKRPELSVQVTKIGTPESSYIPDEICVYYRPKVLIKQ